MQPITQEMVHLLQRALSGLSLYSLHSFHALYCE